MRPSSPLIRIGLLLLALLPAACHISDNTPTGRTPLSIDADTSLTHRDSVVVIVKTSRGADTLFRGKLTGLDTLKHLPAGDYDGSPALVIIQGYQGGQLIYEERQDYTGGARNPPIINVPLDLTAGHPSSLDLRPDKVLLILGGAPIRMEASPADVWKDKALVWTTGDSSVVTVSRTGEVTPVGLGSTYVRAASGDTVSDASSITVVRALPLRDSLTAAPSVVSINDAVSFRARSRAERPR